MAKAEYSFNVPSLEAVETAIAPIEKIGTNKIRLTCAFDDTTEEYRNGKFTVPTDIDTSGTVTLRAYVLAKTAVASKNVALTFGHSAMNDSEASDAANYTDEDADDQSIDATQGDYSEIAWTETVSNLAWAANDIVRFRISRFAATTTNLAGDMYWDTFTIEIPLV